MPDEISSSHTDHRIAHGAIRRPGARLIGYLDLIVIVLSVYVLAALAVDVFFRLPPETSRLLHEIDLFICIFFLIDFCIRFHFAPDKWRFMRWGWVDLIASIPAVEPLRVGRLLRLLRLIRLLRILHTHGDGPYLERLLMRDRRRGAFVIAAVLAVFMIITSSIAILEVEKAPESNIKTAEDALWWSYSTITTVGYGDRYPVTSAGRLVGAVLMTVGVGLFATLAAFIGSWFVQVREEDEEEKKNKSTPRE
jgi:voltage-gated potassium channel